MKIALIKKNEKSEWVSCRSITTNLENMYKKRFGEDVSVWEVPEETDKFYMFKTFSEIKAKGIDHVVFIDHKPTPLKLVEALDRAFQSYSAKLIFHVFGDFTLFSPEWNQVEGILQKRPCHFIAASEGQRKLLANFVDSSNLSVTPFPVDGDFSYSKDKRKSCRESLGVTDEQVFLYTGRISIQKNVVDLVKTFESSVNQFGLNAKLLICGDFDDLGVPFLGKVMPHGNSEMSFLKELEETSGNVIYLGNKSQEELSELYCAADAFVSLSTHNDEDYGMSPAEALCCGLPCVLSGWGGYNSFHSFFPKHVSLADTLLEDEAVKVDLVQFRKHLVASKILNDLDRESLSTDANRILGIKNGGEALTNIFPRINEFKGFQDKFKRFSASFELNPKAPFRSGLGGYSELYKEIYKSYQEV